MRNTDLWKQVNDIIDAGIETYRPEYERLARSSDPEDQEKCFLIASRLRKKGYTSQAFLASGLLSHSFPSLKSYNIYLISAYDLTYKGEKEMEGLLQVFQETWNFYQHEPFEPNITATLLKCCNYLIQNAAENGDDNTAQELRDSFSDIYSKCPEEERNQNSFIIAQHFRRLIANGQKEQVLLEYKQLSLELQNNHTLCKIINQLDSESRKKVRLQTSPARDIKKWTVISEQEALAELKEVLESFSIHVSQVDIQSEKLAEDMNQSTYQAEKAILIIPKGADGVHMERWAFALGYCIHKFGKGNTIVLVDQDVRIDSSSILNAYHPTVFKDRWDLMKQFGAFGLISG